MDDCQLHSFYDRFMRPLELAFLRDQRQILADKISGDALEIGGGTGANLPHIQRVNRYILTEPSWEMCRQIRPENRDENHSIIISSAEKIPFDSERFDAVVSTLVLCTVEDLQQSLSEVFRILRPGGTLFFIEHIRSQGWRLLIQNLLQPIWFRLSCGCHLNRNTLGVISEAGFRIREYELLNPSRFLSPHTRLAIQVALPFVRGTAVKA
jgi:ubiquinone/menaquinone biosynthesis C-methylase UbiE